MPPGPSAGSVLVHRPERTYARLPARRTIELSAPPAVDDEPVPGLGPALLTSVLAAGSGAGFALLSGDPRYLVVCLLLAVASIATGWLTRRVSRRSAERTRKRRHTAYVRHLERATAQTRTAAAQQRDGLRLRHPEVDELHGSVGAGQARGAAHALWPRRPDDPDFGSFRLGLGPAPALVTTATTGGSQPFDPAAEPLRAAAAVLVDGSAWVDGCPVLLDAHAMACIAVVGSRAQVRAILRACLLQLAFTHSPGDLRVVVESGHPPADREWWWARWLPHTQARPSARPGGAGLRRAERTVGVAPEALTSLLAEHPGWTVVVVDHEGPGGSFTRPPHRRDRLTYLVRCDHASQLPAECDAVIRLTGDGTCSIVYAGPEGKVVDSVLADSVDVADAERMARSLAPFAAAANLEAGVTDRLPPPDPVALSALLSKTEAPPMVAPLGRTADGGSIDLDLRESAAGGDGPHGVLVGATGSGKSELLRSLVVALAARTGPERLSLVLVDFKGGATFDAVAALPQVAGLVTNLAEDRAGIDRFQQSLEGELDDRQQRLRDAGVDSTSRYRDRPGALDVPPDLLVVVDEFGELLEVRPELLDTFARIGRLGRSLGIHLLLSSQRLDEGRLRGLESHLGYRIALRTFTASESIAVLGSPAAHDLPPVPGFGLLRTATGLHAFRAATTGLAPSAAPAVGAVGTVGAVVRLLSPWSPCSDRPDARAAADAAGTELDDLVGVVRASTSARARPICLPPLPRRLSLGPLIRADDQSRGQTGHGPIVGLQDMARARRQEPLRVDLVRDGHLGVVGAAGSGRSTVLRTVAVALATRFDPSRTHLYVLDLGGSLDDLAGLPHTAVVAAGHDDEAVRHVLEELQAIAVERVAAAAGTTDEEPRAFLLVDDIGRLRREHPDAEDTLTNLATVARRARIHIALSAVRWTDLRPALLDTVSVRLELRLDEPADSRWPRWRAAAIPPGPGGALSPDGVPTRMALPDGTEPVRRHPDGLRAPVTRPLPRRFHEDALPASARLRGRVESGTGSVDEGDLFLLGLRERRSEPVLLPLLAPGMHLLLLGDGGSGRTTQLHRAARWLAQACGPRDVQLHLVGARRSLLDLARLPATRAHAYDSSSLEQLVGELTHTLESRRPPPGLTAHLLRRRWWDGPRHVLVVDDQDLLPGDDPGFASARGLAPLAALLPHAADIGWHVLLARPVMGMARAAYDPFLARLREVTPLTLVLSGDRSEGAVAGGVAATALPPGRGRLVRVKGGPVGGELVQCALPADPLPG